MSNSFIAGLLLVAAGGVLIGLFSIPITKTPRWSFEHIWGMGSLFALVLLPWPLALGTIPELGLLLRSMPLEIWLTLIACGIGWGIGGIFWGKAVEALGMALGVSLLLGLINMFSSVAPLAIFEPTKLGSRGGVVLMLAVGVMLAGATLIALAGKFRQQEQSGTKVAEKLSAKSLKWGLIFCLLAGIPSTLPNFALLFGRPLADAAHSHGVSQAAQNFPMWAIVFTANFLVNFFYAVGIMLRRGTWRTLIPTSSPSYWGAAIFMGLAWPGGILVYGIGATELGRYGPYVGYPMMILASILAGNLAGAIGGEWKGSQMRSRATMTLGVAVIGAAFFLLIYANRLLSES